MSNCMQYFKLAHSQPVCNNENFLDQKHMDSVMFVDKLVGVNGCIDLEQMCIIVIIGILCTLDMHGHHVLRRFAYSFVFLLLVELKVCSCIDFSFVFCGPCM